MLLIEPERHSLFFVQRLLKVFPDLERLILQVRHKKVNLTAVGTQTPAGQPFGHLFTKRVEGSHLRDMGSWASISTKTECVPGIAHRMCENCCNKCRLAQCGSCTYTQGANKLSCPMLLYFYRELFAMIGYCRVYCYFIQNFKLYRPVFVDIYLYSCSKYLNKMFIEQQKMIYDVLKVGAMSHMALCKLLLICQNTVVIIKIIA